MDVIKQILFLVFLIPFLCFGQKTPYPKDTIYILFDKKSKNKKWLGLKNTVAWNDPSLDQTSINTIITNAKQNETYSCTN